MNEDPTKRFANGESFEARVLSELSAIRVEQSETRKDIAALDSRLGSVEERLTSLEEKVDARLRETRPIWESVLDNIKRLDLKFDEVLRDLFEVRADVKRHERLILQLEKLR
jgi:predicted  nucleic acid-binding Zn-ribbon protein